MFPVSHFGRRPGFLYAHSRTAIPSSHLKTVRWEQLSELGALVGRAVAVPCPLLIPGYMEGGKSADHRGGVQYTKLTRCHPSCVSFCTPMPVTIRENGGKKERASPKEIRRAGSCGRCAWVVHVVAISRCLSRRLAGLVVYLRRTLASTWLPLMPRGAVLAPAALGAGPVAERRTSSSPAGMRCF